MCAALRAAIECRAPYCHIASVASFAAARHTVADLSPDVIVLQEVPQQAFAEDDGAPRAQFADLVATLASFAPVVALSLSERSANMAALTAAGAADLISVDEMDCTEVAACVERRLQSVRSLTRELADVKTCLPALDLPGDLNFGEILRHELNNPLTGILGNAELLLVEMRRHNIAHLYSAEVKRLERPSPRLPCACAKPYAASARRAIRVRSTLVRVEPLLFKKRCHPPAKFFRSRSQRSGVHR